MERRRVIHGERKEKRKVMRRNEFRERKNRLKNRAGRIALFCAVLFLTVLSVGGCIGKPNTKKMLQNYMESRYPDDVFQTERYDFASYDDEYYITGEYFSSNKIPTGEICAYCRKENGQWIFEDNYMMLMAKDEIEEGFQKLAEDTFGPCKVYLHYANLFISSGEPVTTDADAILNLCKAELVIYLSPESSLDGDLKSKTGEFHQKLVKDGKYMVFGTVWTVDSEDYYNQLSGILTGPEMDNSADIVNKAGDF